MAQASKKIAVQTHTATLHPWHGISPGKNCPQVVTCYIEMVPSDLVKYELDKESGHLKVDRPQLYSSQCPTLYGFIPQTYCGKKVGALNGKRMKGDGDPLDICVLSERPLIHGGLLLQAVPIGGLRIVDRNEADDKIIAVLLNDGVYGNLHDVRDCPDSLIDRLRHYFLSYKDLPGNERRKVTLTGTYGREKAHEVIRLSQLDYTELSKRL